MGEVSPVTVCIVGVIMIFMIYVLMALFVQAMYRRGE